jgi:type III pantothenate kinase
MWLAIDIGNTNIHIGIFEEDTLQSFHSVKNASPRTTQVNFSQILTPAILSRIQAVIISSVNPEGERVVHEYIQKYLMIKPRNIGRDVPVPISILTEYPERVGVDRLVNAIAAFERIRDWAIVVDAGTAITIDAIDNKGAFLGGIIAPGVDMFSKALHHSTALLPEVSISKPRGILGKNTEEAIKSGIYWGAVGMVSKLICMLCDELRDNRPTVIATGGNAEMLAQEIPLITLVLPYLTLEGIKITYKTHLAFHTQH